MIYSSLHAWVTPCRSTSTTQNVGPSFDAKTIGYSSSFLAYGTLQNAGSGCNDHVVADGFHTINFTDLYYNPITTSTLYKSGCPPHVNPRLSLPAELTNIDPSWRTCQPLFYGAFDPPRVLAAASEIAPPDPGQGILTSTGRMPLQSPSPKAIPSVPSPISATKSKTDLTATQPAHPSSDAIASETGNLQRSVDPTTEELLQASVHERPLATTLVPEKANSRISTSTMLFQHKTVKLPNPIASDGNPGGDDKGNPAVYILKALGLSPGASKANVPDPKANDAAMHPKPSPSNLLNSNAAHKSDVPDSKGNGEAVHAEASASALLNSDVVHKSSVLDPKASDAPMHLEIPIMALLNSDPVHQSKVQGPKASDIFIHPETPTSSLLESDAVYESDVSNPKAKGNSGDPETPTPRLLDPDVVHKSNIQDLHIYDASVDPATPTYLNLS